MQKDIVYLNNKLANQIGTCYVKENDFLISRSGTIGLVSIVTKEFEGYAFGSYMIKFCTNSNLNKDYLNYYLNTKFVRQYYHRNKIGAIQTNITIPVILNTPIIIPKPDKQIEISNCIRNIIRLSDNLFKESTEIIDKAKKRVEIIILGEWYE